MPRMKSHLVSVVTAVKEHPGLTASELAELTGMGSVEVRRRLTDAKNKGLAYQGEIRKSRLNENREFCWYPERQGVLL
jgi:transcription initiation factor IIE alpha subunit